MKTRYVEGRGWVPVKELEREAREAQEEAEKRYEELGCSGLMGSVQVRRYGSVCFTLPPGAPGFRHYVQSGPHKGRGVIRSKGEIGAVEKANGVRWTRDDT